MLEVENGAGKKTWQEFESSFGAAVHVWKLIGFTFPVIPTVYTH